MRYPVMEKIKSHFGLVAVLVIFFLQCLTLALIIKPTIPPDEIYHFEISEIQAKDLDPFNNNEYGANHLGDISRRQLLYHYINGRLIKLNFFGIDNLLFYRLISIVYSLFTLLFSYKLIY